MKSKEDLTIFVSGKQGAGKATQIELLKKKLGSDTVVYDSGSQLRRFVRLSNVEFAKKIRKKLQEGILAPDWFVLDLFLIFLMKLDGDEHIILDGLPRTLSQAHTVSEMFEWMDRDNMVMLNIEISDEETLRRLARRRHCEKCGKAYNLDPEEAKSLQCKCGGGIVQRDDDHESAIKKRLAWSEKELKPVFELYKKQKRYIKVNGEQNVEDVHKEICEKLGIKDKKKK